MTLRILLAAVLVGFLNTAGAVRVLQEVERPFEVPVSQLTLPRDGNGTLVVRPCANCPVATHRVDGTTHFLLNRREVPFADFARAFNEAKANRATGDATVANVFVDLATGRVTRVTLWSASTPQSAPAPRARR